MTRYDHRGEPDWAPLEKVARVARRSRELPPFHEGEFMYMACVRNTRQRVAIHLYKHYDTRRYLNLDEAGHAYAYRGSTGDESDLGSSGRYQRYQTLVDAVDRLDLWLFEAYPPLFRSLPPDRWPPDVPPVA